MTGDVVIVCVKALAGGALVVAFALIGEILRPKWFAGLFSAAPSVAVASIVVTIADKGDRAAVLEAIGMMFGAAGFVAFALVDRPLLDRFNAVVASSLALLAWLLVGIGGYFLILR